MASELRQRPTAETTSIEDLVSLVSAGGVRIPGFQRDLKWKAKDVVELFDSIYRAYPIGSLLFWKRPAKAQKVQIGPLEIDAPETSAALWVVDGQQRLTSLTVALTRPDPFPTQPIDPFVVYFNAEDTTFVGPPRNEPIPSTWVPLSKLFDSTELSEWVHSWHHQRNEKLRRAVFEAGGRVREYKIPLYIVTADDEKLLREIFLRTNKSGKSLEWDDVHKAMFATGGGHPSSLDELATELAGLGMGTPRKRNDLLPCVLAVRGKDVTQNIGRHIDQDRNVLTGAVAEALPAIRGALSFLHQSCEIPHLRLLPTSAPLIILARFFALHPDPNARSRMLLARWAWRYWLGATPLPERTFKRRGIAAVVPDNEEQSVQHLLALVFNEKPTRAWPESFDARASESRIALLAMAALTPRHLTDETPISIARLIEAEDRDAFRQVVRNQRGSTGPENRILHPNGVTAKALIVNRATRRERADPMLASHAISPAAADALSLGKDDEFLAIRQHDLRRVVESFTDRLAAWSMSDRPSIDHILKSAEA
ncbi:MAG TPA: DUF262 domain-containing protein [Kofleriaceae bacterium]|nr:DUF262 domain-containing protein [Kofleriaceae bacterium]